MAQDYHSPAVIAPEMSGLSYSLAIADFKENSDGLVFAMSHSRKQFLCF